METPLIKPRFRYEETEVFIQKQLEELYPDQKEGLLQWLAKAPQQTYLRVNTVETSRKELIDEISNICTARVCAHELLENVIVIEDDHEVEQFVGGDLKKVVVGSACAASVLRGAEVYAPGILGAPPHLSKGDEVLVYADLDNKLLKGTVKFDTTEKNYYLLGKGRALLSRSDLFKDKIQSGIGVQMTKIVSQGSAVRVNDSLLQPLCRSYFMQNLPSILTVHQLELKPNDKCLDMCAAPGGKTCHIAEIASVLAFDKSQPKIDQILSNAARLGVADKVIARVQDATKAELESESYDKILLDAPCSALGQRPMLVQTAKVKELESFAKLQKKLFEKAVSLLKEGGIMVYSTCTITIAENEELVRWALEKYKDILELCKVLPEIGSSGHKSILGEDCEKVQRFGPDQDSTIGFFIAKFVKVKSVQIFPPNCKQQNSK